MKKILAAVFFVVFLQTVFAQEMNVQVSFNFPLDGPLQDTTVNVSVPNDSNAFSAITKAANQAGIELEINFFGQSAFVECIQDLCTKQNGDDWMFWLFSINNRPSGTGISEYYPKEDDKLALDYFEWREKDALEWLFDKQEENGKIGANSFQHSFALMGLSISADQNISGKQEEKNKAIHYLLSLQQDDAGFGDDLRSAVAIMALLSNGKEISEFEINGTDTLETLTSHQQNDGGFRSGTDQSDVDTTSWVIIAFAQADKALPEKNGNDPADFLLSARHENGSFGYTVDDEKQSIDFTEEALIALSASNHAKDETIEKSLEWLASKQDSEGCIQDGFRTALGEIAFRVWDENSLADKAIECLNRINEAMQNGDGSFGRESNQSNAMDTGIAIIALSKRTFPIIVSDSENGDDSGNGHVGYRSIVKFSARIKNESNVDAQNVNINLEGLPSDWIIEEDSDLNFDEIKKGQTIEAQVFVRMLAAGEYTVQAIVSSDTSTSDFESNHLTVSVEEALLKVDLFVGG